MCRKVGFPPEVWTTEAYNQMLLSCLIITCVKGGGKRGESPISQVSRNSSEACEVPNPYWATVVTYGLNILPR